MSVNLDPVYPLLYAAARAIGVESEYDEVVKSLAEILVPNFAPLCIIDLVSGGTMVRTAFAVDPNIGTPPAVLRAPHVDSSDGVMEVFRSRRPMIYTRRWILPLAQSDEGLRAFVGSALASIVILPLIYGAGCIGVMTAGFTSEMTMEKISPLEMFAQTAAVALANAELLGNAHAAQRKAELAHSRLNHLARASSIFAKSLDQDATLKRFTSSMIGEFADGAAVILRDETDGSLQRIAAGIEPSGVVDEVAMCGFRTARTCLRSEDRAIGLPMMSGGRVSGALVFVRDQSRQGFAIDDLTIAEELASRAAQYIETSQAFHRHRFISHTLQNAFRPVSLPAIPQLSFAAVYEPGTVDIEIGGDWYDVMLLPNGDVAFAIGDVMGHGVEAAAVMAELRYGMRAHLYAGSTPGLCLGHLDRLLANSSREGLFATALIVVLEMNDFSLRIANAGHPAPFLADVNTARTVGSVTMPLGLDDGFREETQCRLNENDVCVVFTDGIIEDRTQSYQQSIERLELVLTSHAESPEGLLKQLLMLNPLSTDDRTAIAFRRKASKKG